MTPTSKDPPAVAAPPGLSVEDACARTGLSRATIYKAIKSGELRLHNIAGRRVIPVAELDEWNRPRVEAARWLGTG